MRHLTVSILVTLAVLLGSAGESFALPECPGSPTKSTKVWTSWNNCEGTYTYANGDKYVGEWKDGNKHGQGTYTYADGDKYVGEFKDGKRHGQGTLYYLANNQFKGDIYIGEFKDGKWHGQGTYTYGSKSKWAGDKYVGEFKDGKKHGQGTVTYADGRVKEGIWENDKFKYAQKITPTVTAKKSPEPSSEVQNENERLRKEIARLKKQNQSKPKLVSKRTPPKKSPPPKSATSGSGFFISKLGHVLTNQHVVDKCESVTVGDNSKKQVTANVLETDPINDLALLKISSMQMASAKTKSLVAKLGLTVTPLASQGLLRPNSVELGEDVVVAALVDGRHVQQRRVAGTGNG